VLQTYTKLSEEPSKLGLFGKKTTIGNEDVANMSFIEPTVHVCTRIIAIKIQA
jgi:hypothetical protein